MPVPNNEANFARKSLFQHTDCIHTYLFTKNRHKNIKHSANPQHQELNPQYKKGIRGQGLQKLNPQHPSTNKRCSYLDFDKSNFLFSNNQSKKNLTKQKILKHIRETKPFCVRC